MGRFGSGAIWLLGRCNLIDDLEGSAAYTQLPEQGGGMLLPVDLREADCLSQAIKTEVYSAVIIQNYAAAGRTNFVGAPWPRGS
jgi:hypothetical protein